MKANFKSIVGEEEAGLSNQSSNNENAGILNKITGFFKSESKPVEDENQNIFQKCLNKTLDNFEVEKSYSVFFMVIAVGSGLLCLSLVFLPVVAFTPQKFVSLFSLGAVLILSSFIFIYGTKEYCIMLFSTGRALISILFIVSIIIGLNFAFFGGNHIVSLVCAIFQLFTLIMFTLSFIPGGQYGISFCWSMAFSPITWIWGKITGKNNNSSFLPQ